MLKGAYKTVGIIPARFASTRFPGKPLALIGNKSLIQWTYENAKQSPSLDLLLVATDDERIYNHVESFGGRAIMTSPTCPTGTDRLAEVVVNHKIECDIVINIQGDEPCLSPAIIDSLVKKLKEERGAVMTTPVVKSYDKEQFLSSSVVKCAFDFTGKALYFSRAPIAFPRNDRAADNAVKLSFYRHLGVYCFKRDFLLTYATLPMTPLQAIEDLEQLKAMEHGYPIHVTVVDDGQPHGIGVDHPEDIKKVESILCQPILGICK